MTNPVAEIINKLDSRGRRNKGFDYINKNKLSKRNYIREFDRYYSFMITDEMLANVGKIAVKQGKSKAEKIREYIEWGLENDE